MDNCTELFGSCIIDLNLDLHDLQTSLLLLKAMLEAGLSPTKSTCIKLVSKMSYSQVDMNNSKYTTTMNLLMKIASFEN